MTEQPSKLSPGEVVSGRYRIERLIARGMADIFEAYDESQEKRFALKLLSLKSEQSSELRDRIIREGEVMARLRTPGVVALADMGYHSDGSFYFVMELLSGLTLGEYLTRVGPLSEKQALTVALQAAQTLEVVHEAGIVHRDIKPDNLFLCGAPAAMDQLKLLDFGLAQFPGQTASADPLVLGTVAYMAPEQGVGDAIDARADIYALGVALFRALTNELPFDVPGHAPLLAHHLLSTAPPPSWLEASLSPDIDRVVTTALRKHPDNRYQSMRALREDLERILVGLEALGSELTQAPDSYEPVSALGRRARKFLSKHHGHQPVEEKQPVASDRGGGR